jgi:hypothetical protein
LYHAAAWSSVLGSAGGQLRPLRDDLRDHLEEEEDDAADEGDEHERERDLERHPPRQELGGNVDDDGD